MGMLGVQVSSKSARPLENPPFSDDDLARVRDTLGEKWTPITDSFVGDYGWSNDAYFLASGERCGGFADETRASVNLVVAERHLLGCFERGQCVLPDNQTLQALGAKLLLVVWPLADLVAIRVGRRRKLMKEADHMLQIEGSGGELRLSHLKYVGQRIAPRPHPSLSEMLAFANLLATTTNRVCGTDARWQTIPEPAVRGGEVHEILFGATRSYEPSRKSGGISFP